METNLKEKTNQRRLAERERLRVQGMIKNLLSANLLFPMRVPPNNSKQTAV
jgi:hypothetical protein